MNAPTTWETEHGIFTLGEFTTEERVVLATRIGVILDRPDLLAVLGVALPRRRRGDEWNRTPGCKSLVRALYCFANGAIRTRDIAATCGVRLGLVTEWTVDVARHRRGAIYPKGAAHPGSLAKKEPAVVAEIRARWIRGASIGEITRELEVSRQTVKRYVRDLPRERSRPGPKPTL